MFASPKFLVPLISTKFQTWPPISQTGRGDFDRASADSNLTKKNDQDTTYKITTDTKQISIQ